MNYEQNISVVHSNDKIESQDYFLKTAPKYFCGVRELIYIYFRILPSLFVVDSYANNEFSGRSRIIFEYENKLFLSLFIQILFCYVLLQKRIPITV